MIYRIQQSLPTTILRISKEIEDFKFSQFFGTDSTLLLKGESPNPYDEVVSMPWFSRINRYVTYTPTLREWQESHYTKIYVQAWIDSMSNPWKGNSSGISVLPLNESNVGKIQTGWQQIINLDLTSHDVYLKYSVVSSTVGGNIHVQS